MRRSALPLFALSLLSLGLSACSKSGNDVPVLDVVSSSIIQGQQIPKEYTCDGSNVPPSITVGRPPANTKSYAILMDDLDTPKQIFVHWMVWNIPTDSRVLDDSLASAVAGINSGGSKGYTGPCPPAGKTHRYVISIYALKNTLDLSLNVNRDQFKRGLIDNVLAKGEIQTTYSR